MNSHARKLRIGILKEQTDAPAEGKDCFIPGEAFFAQRLAPCFDAPALGK